MLQQVKTEDKDEDMVAAPGVGNLFNPGGTRAAWTGVPPYTFLDAAIPSVPPPAAALPLPQSILGARTGPSVHWPRHGRAANSSTQSRGER